jgi:alkanesulfonate monooxygenase SsuD/methylene tetrahydromethanopterin reductase-like flavin-dependent oxidoreductase (luciferase family)
LVERREGLDAACRDVGRDPATLATTVGVTVKFPDLGADPGGGDDPDKALTGDPETVAAGLAAYAALGVDHVILAPEPNTQATLARLAEALDLHRRQAATR